MHDSNDERAKERLFSRYITRCLVEGLAVEMDAKEFYELPYFAAGKK
jgi:hypothetical protein